MCARSWRESLVPRLLLSCLRRAPAALQKTAPQLPLKQKSHTTLKSGENIWKCTVSVPWS
uniref:SECIS binding protein 2 n=1 Tax=Rousettus aegyptiacus TaxID=9407 RepID=A0A7J8IS90_ROUAE|nr:SECIS binding protein 2 [Rousettus aegyptiacus]